MTPVDLSFGTGARETLSYTDYVQKIQASLAYAYDIVRDTLGNVQTQQKTLYDKRVHGAPYAADDQAWLCSSIVSQGGHRKIKLHHPWTGPYVVWRPAYSL